MTPTDPMRPDATRPDADRPDPRRWADRTTTEAAGDDRTVAILPLAAIEQHGPHLPLSTDLDIGLGILAAALDELGSTSDVRVLPALPVGASPEHEALPGTLSWDAGLLEEAIVRTGAAVAASGVRRLILFNAHGGNKATMETAGLRLRQGLGMLVVKASWFRFPRPDGLRLPESEWTHGLHGGAVETSMMLHLHPDRVRSREVRDFPSFGEELAADSEHLGAEGVASFAWMATDLNPAGVTGRASLATPEAGRTLVEHYGAVLAGVVRDTVRFPLDRFDGDGAAR